MQCGDDGDGGEEGDDALGGEGEGPARVGLPGGDEELRMRGLGWFRWEGGSLGVCWGNAGERGGEGRREGLQDL